MRGWRCSQGVTAGKEELGRESSLLGSAFPLTASKTAGLPLSAPKGCFLPWVSLGFQDGIDILQMSSNRWSPESTPIISATSPFPLQESMPTVCSAHTQLRTRPQPISLLLSLATVIGSSGAGDPNLADHSHRLRVQGFLLSSQRIRVSPCPTASQSIQLALNQSS